MKARPILMSAPMVRALLENRKTQTRRIIKPQPEIDGGSDAPGCPEWWLEWKDGEGYTPEELARFCPYAKPGDLLWVRETWGSPDADHPRCPDGKKPQPCDRLVFQANPADDCQWGSGRPSQGGFCWRPSIHMPRWASRLTLELAEVRVERLKDISEAGAQAEGCFFIDYGRRCFHQGQGDVATCPAPAEHHPQRDGWMWAPTTSSDQCLGSARAAYGNLWEFINGPGTWDANPWVWVLSFRVHRCNVDELLKDRAA